MKSRAISCDEELKRRLDQEQAFVKQLGTGKAMAGRGADQQTPKEDKQANTKAAARAKEQLSAKDRQISALAGQLKKAGMTPECPSKRSKSQDSNASKTTLFCMPRHRCIWLPNGVPRTMLYFSATYNRLRCHVSQDLNTVWTT